MTQGSKPRERLWVVSELYYPEETSTGYFVTHIAQGLADRFDVKALCSPPTYSERHLSVPRRERHRGVDIVRVRSTRFAKDNVLGRMVNLITFTLAVALHCLLYVRRGDRLLVLTNPPTLPPLVGLIARGRRARPSLLVHDVYPEVLVATGMIDKGGLLDRALGRLSGATYRLYEHVIVLGRDMAQVLRGHLVGAEDRVTIIPNWGDIEEVHPLDRQKNAFALRHNPEGAAIIQFSGNIGRTHDVEAILRAAGRFVGRDDVLFQFIGYGGKAALVERADEGPAPIVYLPRQPRDMLGGMLAGADAVIIAFVDRMFGVSVPSRMYNVMAAGTPIIAMAHPQSELAKTVEEEDCGWVLAPGDAEGLAALVSEIGTARGRKEARRRGLNGREAVLRRFSYPVVLRQFEELFSRSPSFQSGGLSEFCP